MTVDICPACGYPTIGPTLCAFCRPVEVLTGDPTFEPMFFATELRRGSMSVEVQHPDSNPAARAG